MPLSCTNAPSLAQPLKLPIALELLKPSQCAVEVDLVADSEDTLTMLKEVTQSSTRSVGGPSRYCSHVMRTYCLRVESQLLERRLR